MSLSQALNQFAQNLGRYPNGTLSCQIVDAKQIFRLADTRLFKTAGKHLSAPTVWGGIRKWTKSREEEWGQRAGHRWEEVERIAADCVRRIIAER